MRNIYFLVILVSLVLPEKSAALGFNRGFSLTTTNFDYPAENNPSGTIGNTGIGEFITVNADGGQATDAWRFHVTEDSADWDFWEDNDATSWGDGHDDCKEDNQSPIDITDWEYVSRFPEDFVTQASLFCKFKMENNGRVVIIYPNEGCDAAITIDDTTYILNQVIFHWGLTDDKGSEHTLEGVRYPMEAQIYYKSADERLAALSVWYQLDDLMGDMQLSRITERLPEITKSKSEIELGAFTVEFLLPADKSYYRYTGSLTTPPCTQDVTWIVYAYPQRITTDQLEAFRQLHRLDDSSDSSTLGDNVRPLQDRNDRKIIYKGGGRRISSTY